MVVQIGLSVTLLVVAGLFARTVALLLDEGAGVEPTRALVVRVVLGDTPILDASERDHRLVEEMVARPHGYLGSTDCASQTTLSTANPGFPIWLWYFWPSDQSSRLDCRGFPEKKQATEGDTQWVHDRPSPFSSRSTDF